MGRNPTPSAAAIDDNRVASMANRSSGRAIFQDYVEAKTIGTTRTQNYPSGPPGQLDRTQEPAFEDSAELGNDHNANHSLFNLKAVNLNTSGQTVQPNFLTLGGTGPKPQAFVNLPGGHSPLGTVMQTPIQDTEQQNIQPNHIGGVSSLPARLQKTYVVSPAIPKSTHSIPEEPDPAVLPSTTIPDPPDVIISGKRHHANRKKDLYSQAEDKEALLKRKKKKLL